VGFSAGGIDGAARPELRVSMRVDRFDFAGSSPSSYGSGSENLPPQVASGKSDQPADFFLLTFTFLPPIIIGV
jgi:hypothetical protein